MKNVKQIFIFIGISLLSIAQVLLLYNQYTNQLSFFPDWKSKIDQQIITISNNQGVFFKIAPDNYHCQYKFTRENNTLTVSQKIDSRNDGSNDIWQTISLCKNCYVINEQTKQVLTQKNPNDDIVLKKKVISRGYTILSISLINLDANSILLGVFDPINDKKILISVDQPAVAYLQENGRKLRIKITIKNKIDNNFVINQKNIFL